MHGAMVAQGYDDPEGDLLSKIRALVGPDCFVSSELDPHSHLTDLRFNSADLCDILALIFLVDGRWKHCFWCLTDSAGCCADGQAHQL
jgi:hypothetical protein